MQDHSSEYAKITTTDVLLASRRDLVDPNDAIMTRKRQKLAVLLVTPPSGFLADEQVFPSLGILKVAAALESADVAVAHLDLSGVENYCDVMLAALKESDPSAIGFTATTPQLPAVRTLAAAARLHSDARLILGGAHATLAYAARKMEEKRGLRSRATRASEWLEETFDTIVCGDGESAVLAALSSDAPKVIDADDRKAAHWISREAVSELPMPARHLLDLDSYHYEIDGHRATSLIGQLGCPFHCGFCGGRSSPSLRISRVRSVESVVAEVRHIHETYGYTGFMFYDDELNVSPTALSLMQALRALQLELGVEFRLRGFVKAELFTEQLATAMYAAGFRWILCGFESAHPRILTNIRKRATLEDNTRVLEIADRYGLKVKALVSIGHPGETRASVEATKDWLLANEVDEFDVTIITPYPGTPYYDEAVELAGVWTYTQPETGDRQHSAAIDYSQSENYYKVVPGEYEAMVWTDALSTDDLVELRDDLEAAVRAELKLPYADLSAAKLYDHSMGQSLRRSRAGVPV